MGTPVLENAFIMLGGIMDFIRAFLTEAFLTEAFLTVAIINEIYK
jgi:hypothetical protein